MQTGYLDIKHLNLLQENLKQEYLQEFYNILYQTLIVQLKDYLRKNKPHFSVIKNLFLSQKKSIYHQIKKNIDENILSFEEWLIFFNNNSNDLDEKLLEIYMPILSSYGNPGLSLKKLPNINVRIAPLRAIYSSALTKIKECENSLTLLGRNEIPEKTESLRLQVTAVFPKILSQKQKTYNNVKFILPENTHTKNQPSPTTNLNVTPVVSQKSFGAKIIEYIADLYGQEKNSSLLDLEKTINNQAFSFDAWWKNEKRIAIFLIKEAQKNPIMKDSLIKMKEALHNLKKVQKFKNKDNIFLNIDIEIEKARYELSPTVTKANSAYNKLEENIGQIKHDIVEIYQLTKTPLGIFSTHEEIKKTSRLSWQDNAEKCSIQCAALPQTQNEINELAYHAFDYNFKCNSTHAPIQWSTTHELKIAVNLQQNKINLLENLNVVFQKSPALYYVTLLISMVLVALKFDQKNNITSSCEDFLLNMSGDNFAQALNQLSQSLDKTICRWLLSYIPCDLKADYSNEVMVAITALVCESKIPPESLSKNNASTTVTVSTNPASQFHHSTSPTTSGVNPKNNSPSRNNLK